MPLSPTSSDAILAVNSADKWSIYHRLQELGISCHCGMNQPLRVQITHPLAAIQVWTVVKSITAPRTQLVQQLDHCWLLENKS